MTEDTTQTVTLLGTDQLSGGSLAYRIERLPSAGTLYRPGTTTALNVNDYLTGNTVDYLPVADFFGLDTFRYTAVSSISQAESVPATVTLNITNVNDAPRPQKQTFLFFQLDGNTTFQLAVDEPDGDAVTYTVTPPPSTEGLLYQYDQTQITAADTTVTDVLARLVFVSTKTTTPGTQGYLSLVNFNAVDTHGAAGTPADTCIFVKNALFAGNATQSTNEDTKTTITLDPQDYYGRAFTVYLTELPTFGT